MVKSIKLISSKLLTFMLIYSFRIMIGYGLFLLLKGIK